MIPKRIIQTWKSKQVPREYRKYQKRLRELNPDYEFLLFTDEEVTEFVETEYPQFLDAFNSFPEIIYKMDLFRLLAVHKLGGIYLDLDVYPLRSFDSLLEHDCVFPFEGQVGKAWFYANYGVAETIGQYAFAAKAGHPFLLACAEKIRGIACKEEPLIMPSREELAMSSLYLASSLDTVYKEQSVIFSTGPGLVTRTYLEQPESHGEMKILSVRNTNTDMHIWFCFGPYAVHRMGGEWRYDKGLFAKIVSLMSFIMFKRRVAVVKKYSCEVLLPGLKLLGSHRE